MRSPQAVQSMKPGTVLLLAFTAVLLCFPGTGPVQAAVPEEPGQTPEYTEGEIPPCLYCHSLEPVRAILDSPHGDKSKPDSPYARHGCESCHGDASQHVVQLRLNKPQVSMITYGPQAATPVDKQSQSCLHDCHERKMGDLEGMEWTGSVHARPWVDSAGEQREMSCVACHKVHETHESLEDRTQQAKVCYQCHEKTEREHPRFEDKGIVFDRLTCWDCHDVHQLIPQEPESADKRVRQ
jgi:predicted CXXCH cytochrome family protein